jgi:5-methyltetrahydropteroyltriglutamate--homocysteine methyltransferase
MQPFLTTHTGSLPRPRDLAQLLWDREDRKLTPGLDQRIQQAVVEVVGKQVAAGVDVVNDGEMGKIGYATYVKDRLTGFEIVTDPPPRTGPVNRDEFPDIDSVARPNPAIRYAFSAACTGPVRARGTEAAEQEIKTLKAAAQQAGAEHVFMSAASPGVISFFIEDRHYRNHEAYLADIAEAMRPEYRAIVESGITLQIDCPDLAMLAPRFPTLAEFRRFAEANMEALNHALQGLPQERLRIHICWGNYEGPHNHDVELKDIIDIVLKADAAGLSLEACNPRHAHEWRVFEDVPLPDDRYLLPGVIDSTNNFVEHPDLVAERLLNYGRLVGAERVIGSSDCGFGTFAGSSAVAPSVVWAKLATMAEGARRARARASSEALPQRTVAATP